MKSALRLLLTLFTILCSTTISGASIQESQAGVIFEEAGASRGGIGFFDGFIAPKTGGKADFIVSPDGAVVHNSRSAVRGSLDGAGFKGKKITNPSWTETGTIHNGPVHPSRVVTTRQGTRQPVNPADGSNFGNVQKAEQRARIHIAFSQ